MTFLLFHSTTVVYKVNPIPPPTLTNIHTRFLFRGLYIFLLHIKWWRISENSSPVPQIVFSDVLKTKILKFPRNTENYQYFKILFFKRGESDPKMLGWYYKVFQTIRNYQEISFNVKFVILGQELAIWLGGPESALPLVFFSALYELIRSIIPHLGQKFWIWDV